LPFAVKPTVIGGRYGLVVEGIYAGDGEGHLRRAGQAAPKNHFTIGIDDDVTHTSLSTIRLLDRRSEDGARAVLRAWVRRHGGREQELDQDHRQRDAELRAGLLCVRLEEVGVDDDVAPAVRAESDPVELSDYARQLCGLPQLQLPGEDERGGSGDAGRGVPAELALSAAEVWDHLPKTTQQEMLRKKIEFYVIDGYKVAREAGMGTRINTIMQTCFFAISGVLPREEAIAQIKKAITEDLWQARRGGGAEELCRRGCTRWRIWKRLSCRRGFVGVRSDSVDLGKAPEFVRNVLGRLRRARRLLPVSAIPAGRGVSPRARRSGRSGTLRSSFRCGTRICASSAASA
jgi:pyruvate-ferredoxin/flavodoxin oxidoreductase